MAEPEETIKVSVKTQKQKYELEASPSTTVKEVGLL